MRNSLPFFSGSLLVLLTGCSHFAKESHSKIPTSPSKNVTIVYQSNRQGELEPCGCQKKPFGGIDREANALKQIRKESEIVWYVDAGNMLTTSSLKNFAHRSRKAEALIEILKAMKLDVFAPGPEDFTLGIDFLLKAQEQSSFSFVSTNGKYFKKYHTETRGGIRFTFLALSPESPVTQEPTSALKEALAEVVPKSDFIILLSQLGAEKDEALARDFPEVQVIVGSDPQLALERPFLFHGRTLQVDPHQFGYQLGKLELQLRWPFRGFFSYEEMASHRQKMAFWESRLEENPKNQVAKDYLYQIKETAILEPQEGGSEYKHQLISLDGATYGTPNVITGKIKRYRESVRKAALVR